MFKVQIVSLDQFWTNEDGSVETFPTEQAAQQEIDNFIIEIQDCADMFKELPTASDFKVVPV